MSNSAIAVFRVIHIAFGSFWLGGAITLGFFLLPASKMAAGLAYSPPAPMRALAAVSVGGLVAMFAGFILYGAIWADAGFSGPARWYAIGAYFAAGAIATTAVLGGPAAFRLGALASKLSHQASPLTEEQRALRLRLLDHLTWASRLTAALLLVSVAFMAIGRYV